MKKLFSINIVLVLSLLLSSCNNNNTKIVEPKVEDVVIDLENLSGEITISTFLEQSAFLSEAAKSFEEKNPGTKININTFYQLPEIKTAESDNGTVANMEGYNEIETKLSDYQKQISVDLMGGQGADIYSLTNLTYMDYADQGFLDNFESYFKADSSFDINKYHINIINGMKYKNQLFAMPIDFAYAYISADKELVSEEIIKELSNKKTMTVNEVIENGQKIREAEGKGIKSVMFRPVSTFIADAIVMEKGKYIDYETRKANLNSKDFIELIETAKKYVDDGLISKDLDDIDYSNVNINELQNMYNAQNPFYMNNSQELPFAFLPLDDFKFPDPAFKDMFAKLTNKKPLALTASSKGDTIYSPINSFCINSKSANKSLSWAFISYLLQMETQSSMNLTGSPVLKGASAEQNKSMISGKMFQLESASEVLEDGLTAIQKKALEDYTTLNNSFIENLTMYQYMDNSVIEKITKEVSSFIKGEQTAEEAAKRAQENVELYLNE